MMLRRLVILLILGLAGLASPAAAAVAPRLPLLTRSPLGEAWFRLSLSGERTGFACQSIAENAAGYTVTAASSVKMVVLGFSRQAASREEYQVNRDLSLRSFRVEETLDGVSLSLAGEATAKGVKVSVRRGGEVEEKLLKVRGPVYPPPLINLYPLFKGVVPGKKYRLQMLDIEAVKLKEVTIAIGGVETGADGRRVVTFTNDLYPLVDNEVWVDPAGHTLRESVRDGLVETVAEERLQALHYIATAALARRDTLLDYSLLRIEPPLAAPTTLRRLVLEVTGLPAAFPLPAGGGQEARRLDDGRVRFTVEPGRPAAEPAVNPAPFLAATESLPATDPAIEAAARAAIGAEPAPAARAKLLAHWVADSIRDEASGPETALAALQAKQGDSLARARLYVALARAVGIPSRVVSGLVYLAGKGFLYHSWGESLLDGSWQQVDPAFDQLPVDASHIKLVNGESAAELAALGGVVGMLQARVVEAGGAEDALPGR